MKKKNKQVTWVDEGHIGQIEDTDTTLFLSG